MCYGFGSQFDTRCSLIIIIVKSRDNFLNINWINSCVVSSSLKTKKFWKLFYFYYMEDDIFNTTLRDTLSNSPFGVDNEPTEVNQGSGGTVDHDVHIWVRQRGRKHITTISSLTDEKVGSGGLEGLTKNLKKKFACIGTVKKDEKTGQRIIEFSGDQRENVRKYLLENKIVDPKNLNIHGF